MRLALFSSTIDITCGYGNITYELCMAMHKKGVELVLFLPREEAGLVKQLAVPFEVRCILPRYVVRFNAVNVWPHLKAVDVRGFDLVHSLLDIPHCVIAQRSAKKYKLPFLMGSQGTYGVAPLTYAPDKYLLKAAYRYSKRIVVPSKFTKEKILEYAHESYPIDIIHNGVNFERFQKKVDTTYVRGLFPGKTTFLTVGNFKERRGQDLVLRALAQVKKKRSDVAYVMVGGGSLRTKMEALADELGVRDIVHFAGQKKDDELLSYFQGCNVYIHTPRVFHLHFEGFGIVYLEASACGKPIIATDAGGIRDAVVDGETGLVVGDEDIEGIAGAMERMLDDADLRKRLGEGGHRYAQKHDWATIADAFLALYHETFHV